LCEERICWRDTKYFSKVGEATSTNYTMRSKEKEVTFQVNVVVKYSKGKYGRNGIEYFAYAVYIYGYSSENIHLKNIENVLDIESSYRLNEPSTNTHKQKIQY
jgi:putative transposase